MPVSATNPLPAHPVIERIRRFRLLYAIAVHAIAVLILAAILWASRVNEFQTVGFVDIKSTVASANLGDPAVDSVSDCIRRAAGDDSLAKLLNECRDKTATSALTAESGGRSFPSAELDRLRQRMAFAVVPHADGERVRISVMLAGRGTPLEQRLVESFLGSVSDQVTLASALPAGHQSLVLSENQLRDLRRERDRLLSLANEQLGDVNLRLVGIANVLLDGDAGIASALPEDEAGRQGNPFMQASFGNASPAGGAAALTTLHEKFAAIPLDELSATFAAMEVEWDRALRPLATLVGQQARQMAVQPLRAVSRGEVLQAPHGVAVPREWLLLAVAAALALGCVLASGVDARWHDPGFECAKDMERGLGVPVLGTLRTAEPAQGRKPRVHWSLRILKLNELVVFTTLLALCVVAVASPEIRDLLVINPLHAVTRIVWSFRSIV